MAEGEDPGDYIDQRRDLHDCFFLVGTEKKERISTVKYFLANYSSYFRAMLLETDMREKTSKEDIVIPDHEPDVFRLMLSYVYGRHDIKFKDVNQAMRFHVLVDKCLMPKLKKISTDYLMQNCNTNLCDVLECAILLEIKEMEPRAKKIVEKDTKALLSSPGFLNTHPVILEFIVKQEGLSVTEVELWRALVKWGKQQCRNTRGGSVVRMKIENIIQHVQFLKMSLKEFAEEVVPTSILTPAETIDIFVKMATGKGNPVGEAASKTRHEWSQPQPTSCVLSFHHLVDQNMANYYLYHWECYYEIISLCPRKFRIHSIELSSLLSERIINLGGYGKYLSLKLTNGIGNGEIVEQDLTPFLTNQSSRVPVTSLIFNLSNKSFIVRASHTCTLHVRFSTTSPTERVNYNNGFSANVISVVESCDFCKVQLTHARCSGQFGIENVKSSIVKSFTFSMVDPSA